MYQSTRTHGVKCLKPVVFKDNNDKIKFRETLGISSPASLVTYVLFGRGAQTSQKFKSHLKILDARRVTLTKSHTEGPHKCAKDATVCSKVMSKKKHTTVTKLFTN
jgi:hypothetical protein